MILIYSHISTSRLQYVCSFIFKELMGIDFKLTIDSQAFKNHTGAKINYNNAPICADEFYLLNHNLLFEQNIKDQSINCFTANGYKAFFKTDHCDFPFDIFAAAFYLLSRYEEYLPHEKDMYGRYDYENSLAQREGFLHLPLVNTWVNDLAEKLKNKFDTFNFQLSAFNYIPTYDIDIAYSYKHKGFLRNMGGFLKSPGTERLRVLRGAVKDPFDCYDWLDKLHEQYDLKPLYFFLVAEENSRYDKNILPYTDAMWKLINQHAKKYRVGLHPSWQSGDNKSLLKKEREQLEAMCNHGVTMSRQHYIRFNLPEGYQRLSAAGFTEEYSMGYGSVNGFRASVASSFYWYDLEKEMQTGLRIHPFCFMDANSFYEQRQNTLQTQDELQHYLDVCKAVNGTMISIWHNNFLGTSREFEGWKEMYSEFMTQVQQ